MISLVSSQMANTFINCAPQAVWRRAALAIRAEGMGHAFQRACFLFMFAKKVQEKDNTLCQVQVGRHQLTVAS